MKRLETDTLSDGPVEHKTAPLAFTKDKNQIATPWYIVDFMYDLTGARGRRVLDPTAGNGNLLEHAGERYGIELENKAYKMLTERYRDGNYINASVFESGEWIKSIAPDVVLMNPPFNAEKTKGLEFVRFIVQNMESGIVAAILPAGALNGTRKDFVSVKRDILERSAVRCILKLNKDMFYPAVSVQTYLIVLEVGAKQAKTYFADFSYDGMAKHRTLGMIDKNNTWLGIKTKWLDYIKAHQTNEYQEGQNDDYIVSGLFDIAEDERWSTEYKMPRPIGSPTEEDFKKTVHEYLDYKIKTYGLEKTISDIYAEESPQEKKKRLERQIDWVASQLAALEKEYINL